MAMAPQTDMDQETRLLLFVKDDNDRRKYLDALAGLAVQVFVTSSFFRLSEELCRRTYHGLLIDLPTKMHSIKENKAVVYRLIEKFPSAHLQVDRKTGAVRCLYAGMPPKGNLQEFIRRRCHNVHPQKLKALDIVQIHLPALIYTDRTTKRPERTITISISRVGCFVFSVRRRKPGSMVEIIFPTLSDPAPISAKIQSVVRWEDFSRISGFELEFIDTATTQIDDLARLCRLDIHQ